MKKKKLKKKTLLRGEGANQHTLYGDFLMDEKPTEFAEITVLENSLLKHEQPSGEFAEHNTLKIEEGAWVQGKQIEYNPFRREISQIWD
jgi:hypothetical protein